MSKIGVLMGRRARRSPGFRPGLTRHDDMANPSSPFQRPTPRWKQTS